MSTRSPTSPKRRYRMVARAEAAEATRQRILEAAWRQFVERPYDDVRLADIAAEAEVTVPTVHNGFGPKEGLFVAVWAWMASRQVAPREQALPGDVGAAVRLLYDSYEQDADAVLRLLAQEDRIPAIRQMADAGRLYHRGWVERTFTGHVAGLTGGARERRLAALVVATDVLVWKLLRREMGLEREVAERIVIDMIDATRREP